ncbi:MAG: hypothetical protein QOI56_1469, partial [Actinomycetota bacterium]|nr:hypothetical protein [Actinomycetota bacterium]
MVNTQRRPSTAPPARRWPRRPLVYLAVAVVVLAGAFGLYHSIRASRAALDGKAALLRAEALLGNRRLEPAKVELLRAGADFDRSHQEIRTIVRYLPFARAIPLVGSQVRGVDELSQAGVLLSTAGVRLADAATGIIHPADGEQRLSDAIDRLRGVQDLLRQGVASIDAAKAKVDHLDRERLIRPLGRARTDLSRRLPAFRDRATGAEDALSSMITFAGGDGPRRYLVLSQNPDEVRPTGGFIGTYGVLSAVEGNVTLERYDSIESWIVPRPDVTARPAERGSPLRFDSRISQTLANVNTSPDWPQGAQLAARLWERGGEEPVQGVVSFTPTFLARILRVVGPVTVESYGETITADNLVERLDYYTHVAPPEPGTGRKDLIGVLAQAIMPRLFDAPASQWDGLAQAFGDSFGNRDAMAWSTDAEVARVLAERGWDGSVPVTTGDFMYPSEFEYSAKHGRQLRRTYEHHVAIQRDGSARITTTVKIVNPSGPDIVSSPPDTLTYITMYGPAGAVFDTASDPLGVAEPAVAGHPGYGWFRSLAPLSETSVTVVWDAPGVAKARPDGSFDYSLRWMRLPDHAGDTLDLSFELPA